MQDGFNSSIDNANNGVISSNSNGGNVNINNADVTPDNLSLFGYFVKCLKKYAGFAGRARRKELWGFFLAYTIIFFGWLSIEVFLENAKIIRNGVFVNYSLYVMLALTLPGIAVWARRLHDIGKSGWNIFLLLVPFANLAFMIMWAFKGSDAGANKYGANPKIAGAKWWAMPWDIVAILCAALSVAGPFVIGGGEPVERTNVVWSWSSSDDNAGKSEAQAFIERAMRHYEAGNYGAAISDATEAIRINPNHADAYLVRGMAHDKLKNVDAAISDLTEVLRHDPSNVAALLLRGLAYERDKNDRTRACADMNEVLRHRPGHQSATAFLQNMCQENVAPPTSSNQPTQTNEPAPETARSSANAQDVREQRQPTTAAPQTQTASGFRIQIRAAETMEDARQERRRARRVTDHEVTIEEDQQFFKVFVGEFNTRAEAQTALPEIRKSYPDAWIAGR